MTDCFVRWCAAPLACAAAMAISAQVAFQRAAAAPADALEGRLLADAADGRLDEVDFFTAALVASGAADAAEVERYRSQYEPLRDSIAGACHDLPPEDRLAAVQTLVHERILTGQYRASASDLRLALVRGDSNCLSALAVCYDICQAAGIDVVIRAAPGHVLLTAENADLPDDFRRITPVELLGRFYYNRGVLALEADDFAAGIDWLRTSLLLDPHDADARENLLAGYNNWAAAECRRGEYASAARLIDEGLAIDAAFAPLLANQRLLRRIIGADRQF